VEQASREEDHYLGKVKKQQTKERRGLRKTDVEKRGEGLHDTKARLKGQQQTFNLA